MKRAVFVVLIFASATLGQAPPAYTPTEVQSLRIQVLQRDAQIARMNYQSAINALSSEGEKIRAENKWPDTVSLDLNTLQFVDHKPPDKPKEAPKPEAGKP